MYKIELSGDELLYIGKLLEKQPYADVHALVARVQAQINEQDRPSTKAPEPAVNEVPKAKRAKRKKQAKGGTTWRDAAYDEPPGLVANGHDAPSEVA
jgi:hypothetical protein